MSLNKDSDELSILVDIDCIFDLRLSLLHKLNKDKTKQLLLDGKYSGRVYDDFGFIDSTSFRILYKDLIDDLIYEAPLTPMLNFVIEYITEASHASLKMGASDNMVVYLNIYPLAMDPKLIEDISKMIYSRLPDIAKLVVINKSNSDLKPEWVKDNLAAIIKYNGLDWLNLHLSTGELIKNPIPDVSLFVPAIFMDKAMVHKNLYQKFFEDRASEYSYYIKTDFLNSKIFSVMI